MRHVTLMRECGNMYRSLVKKHVRMRPFRKAKCRLEDNCEMDLRKYVLKL
jgi:hypothetical protein